MLLIDEYDYDLAENRIAKYPVEPRDQSKLLVYRSGEIQSSIFRDISNHLPSEAHLVFNETKVIPARLKLRKSSGAAIEIFLLEPHSHQRNHALVLAANKECVWKCMIGNKKKWKGEALNTALQINDSSISLEVSLENHEDNLVKFTWSGLISFAEVIQGFGQIPLPPYLNREAEQGDQNSYQTVYSNTEGAVAAPTAGLHFTEEVLNGLSQQKTFLTLHVGAGTFQPIKEHNVLKHHMHNEQVVISIQVINDLLSNHEMIIPVGTTSMRSLESLYWFGVKLLEEGPCEFFIDQHFAYQKRKEVSLTQSFETVYKFMLSSKMDILMGNTEIFIYPGYTFKVCKGIITNFHQPKSTLILLISALIGDNWKRVYDYALQSDYRFLSFGDSSLLLP